MMEGLTLKQLLIVRETVAKRLESAQRVFQSVINHPESFFYKTYDREIREAKEILVKVDRAISEKRELVGA